MICPRCEQGVIHALRIVATGSTVYVCAECDALWLRETDVSSDTFQDLNHYMEKIGLPYSRGEFENPDS